ncbi:hypothetical protein CHS0354_024483 [Potamilus streckersoni]|uniref:Uncharacterized protein n=1 Tax=Potamilus streckersoni TaxID=2493646 RepID=A0AAE0WHH3_9BIVA|nr:hypothetical protein CHS0354_024483 [Potamilus streckersoni]
MYLVNLNVSVCMEQSECLIQVPVFRNTKIRKIQCNWNQGFQDSDFSLTKWMEENKLDPVKDVVGLAANQLVEELGIAKYLRSKPCILMSSSYTPNVDGWKSDCNHSLSFPSITGPVSCYVPDYCTAIDCCIDVRLIDRAFNIFVDLDACNYNLIIGIENYNRTISLLDYEWGKPDQFYLLGVVRIE